MYFIGFNINFYKIPKNYFMQFYFILFKNIIHCSNNDNKTFKAYLISQSK